MATPAHSSRPRLLVHRIALFAAATGLAGCVAALLRFPDTPTPEPEAIRPALMWLGIAGAWTWAALTVVWATMVRGRGPGFVSTATLVIVVAMLARILVVIGHEPRLSDDIYRYIFDGRNLAAGVNPYLVTPRQRMEELGLEVPAVPDPSFELPPRLLDADEPRWTGEAALIGRVNNPEMATIYLPTSQYLFGGLGWVANGWELTRPASMARLYRAGFVGVECLMLLVLATALHRADRSAWWLTLYAWHPLALAEIAGSGHQDILGAGLLAATAWTARTPIWTACLAAGGLVKPFIIPVAALLLRGRSWRSWALSLATGAVIVAGMGAPLLLAPEGQPFRNLESTSSRFSAKWAYFGSVYEPALALLERVDPIGDDAEAWRARERHEAIARGICLVVFASVAVVIFAAVRCPWSSTRTLLVAMVLCSTTAHPWYLLWALVLAPRAPSATLWVLSLTLPLAYAPLWTGGPWSAPAWVLVAAYGPVYTVGVVELGRRITGGMRDKGTP